MTTVTDTQKRAAAARLNKLTVHDEVCGCVRAPVHDTQTLGANMDTTPEGFLVCRDVALARTGTQVYGYWEVPAEARGTKDSFGMVTVERHEDDVFDPETIESFRGKPFTDDHPWEDVTPANYKDHLIGVVQNPRRGTGDRANYLLGDIMVYNADAIDKIRAGKREVSCGYDAAYEITGEGRARQREIRGNHVSLVDAGRCGAACAITDGVPAKERSKMPATKKSIMDRIRAFAASHKDSDEATREEELRALEAEMPDVPEEEGSDKDKSDADKAHHNHITLNIGGSDQGTGARDHKVRGKGKDEGAGDPPPEGEGDDAMCTKEDLATAVSAAVNAAVAPLLARIEELTSTVEDVAEDSDDTMTQDAVMRAEILKPGLQLPVLDAAPGSKAHRDAIVNVQRKALKEAFATTDGKAAIAPLVTSARPNFDTMAPEVLAVVFRGASQTMRDANNMRAAPTDEFRAKAYDAEGKRGPLTADSWNSMNREFWRRQAKAA